MIQQLKVRCHEPMHSVNDCPSFIGLSFWKSPRRIIYSVLRAKLISLQKQKKKAVIDADSDDDFEPTMKKKRNDDTNTKIEKVAREVGSLKSLLTDVVTITKEMKVPLGLMNMMRSNFKCQICHRIPLCPPVIVSKCCKVILGCESCVNKWYSTGPNPQSQCCPSCGTERAYNETMILKGLDDFLKDIKQVIGSGEEKEGDEDPTLPAPMLALQF